MNQTKENVGSQIENMVRKQQISIVDFANMINCSRKNVYDIFQRNSIDIELLARISKVLGHNFFKDVADNYELAMPTPADEKEEERRKAVCQFLDVVPRIFTRLKINASIVLGVRNEEEINLPLPDYVISPYMFTVTIGESIEERLNGKLNGLMHFQKFSDENGSCVLLCHNEYTKTQSIDIKLDYKSEEEWESVVCLALEVAEKYYNDKTKFEIRRDLQFMKMYD
jgi:plasmid maintenance system antidote protein VapI